MFVAANTLRARKPRGVERIIVFLRVLNGMKADELYCEVDDMRKNLSKFFLFFVCLITVFALSGCPIENTETSASTDPEITARTTPNASITPEETIADEEVPIPTEAPVEYVTVDKIVFTQSILANGYYGIYTMNVDGTDIQKVIDYDSAVEFYPVVSPDGTKIAFVSNMSTRFEIYVINPDGTGLLCLTDNANPTYDDVCFSPDSQTIFYHSYVDEQTHVASVNIDGTDQKILSPGFTYYDSVLDISPDGQRIAFASNHEGGNSIYSMDVDGSNIEWLAHGTNPCFSPDGEQIYFISGIYGNGYSIWVMDSDGENVQSLTEETLKSFDNMIPHVSPDGTKILFATDSVYIMNTDGSDITALTNREKRTSLRPSFSPDGKKIVFTASVDEFPEIFSMNVDGSDLVQLTDGSGFSQMPSYARIVTTQGNSESLPSSETISLQEGSLVFISQSAGAVDIYSTETGETDVTRLTKTYDAETSPVFSPDGSKVAYIMKKQNSSELYIMNPDGTEQTLVTAEVSPYSENIPQFYLRYYDGSNPIGRPCFSPDGEIIYFTADEDDLYSIYSVNVDGSGLRKLGEGQDPCVSPDGSKIVYCVYGNNPAVWIMNSNGSQAKKLTDGTRPAFSPDGKTIAYLSTPLNEFWWSLYIMDVDGDDPTLLADYVSPNSRHTFSPDSTRIAFEGSLTASNIYAVNIDGSGMNRISYGEECDMNPQFSADGKHIIYLSTRDNVQKIYVSSATGVNETLVYDTESNIDSFSFFAN